eukprot:NODE_4634_length_760_cov_179.624013_g4475_i0.p1 GENE.NODE_4634_length_760_cov_179.624013_g4475_i0~~NODE_4634_length_760_cov_179.624013_g4475_i0.p1  ORF type:complete len:196 (-),score=40.83 NODE_4634_length_760_cov_179.624013_g4475_i0:120-707(-)
MTIETTVGSKQVVPIYNGSHVDRCIQYMRVPFRLTRGVLPTNQRLVGLKLHPWSMYTDKGDYLWGSGTQLARNYPFKTTVFLGSLALFSYCLMTFYQLAGSRPRSHTRAWKEAERNYSYPVHKFPDIVLPPDVDRNPNSPIWQVVSGLSMKPPLQYTLGYMAWQITHHEPHVYLEQRAIRDHQHELQAKRDEVMG